MDYLKYGKKDQQKPRGFGQEKIRPLGVPEVQEVQDEKPIGFVNLDKSSIIKKPKTGFPLEIGNFGNLGKEQPAPPQQAHTEPPGGWHQMPPRNHGQKIGQKTELVSLFASPVVITRYPDEFTKELEWCRNEKCDKNNAGYNNQSENTFVLDDPVFTNLRKWIEFHISEYVRTIYNARSELVITQSWLNKSGKNQSHHEHRHPNSIVSGVWYPQINSKLPPIKFYTPTQREIEMDLIDHNQWNSSVYMLPLNAGELILFPSTLQHSVPINTTDEERISLSFNTWAKGNLGKLSSLTYLPLDRCV